jgi:hypothetical protein
MEPRPFPYRPELEAPGVDPGASSFLDVLDVDELPPGAMRRVTVGDLDVLLAHTPDGIVAVDDRCPHMSAPLSIGELDGCVVLWVSTKRAERSPRKVQRRSRSAEHSVALPR